MPKRRLSSLQLLERALTQHSTRHARAIHSTRAPKIQVLVSGCRNCHEIASSQGVLTSPSLQLPHVLGERRWTVGSVSSTVHRPGSSFTFRRITVQTN